MTSGKGMNSDGDSLQLVDVEGALLGTGLPPKGGYGLLISVFIIKDKLKLGAWSLVIMDVSVVPQAYMASYSLAPPQIRA